MPRPTNYPRPTRLGKLLLSPFNKCMNYRGMHAFSFKSNSNWPTVPRLNRRLVVVLLLVISILLVFGISQPREPHDRQSIREWTRAEPQGTSRSSLPVPKPDIAEFLNPDYPEGVEDVFLMVKTGATVLWQRLPIHFSTTFRHVPFFQIYSDMQETIVGHQVIDTLANGSDTLKESPDFEIYRIQQELKKSHSNLPVTGHWGISQAQKGWDLDKYKNLPMLQHAWATKPNAKWFVFMDGDSYIMWAPLMKWLRTLNHRHALYMGSVIGAAPGEIEFGHGGSGVVVSRGAMLRAFGDNSETAMLYENQTAHDCCGDHMVAQALYDNGVQIAEGDGKYPFSKWKFQGEPHWLVYANRLTWCSPIMSFHHVTPQDIEEIHELEKEFQLKHPHGEYIRYVDLYHKFMRPWLVSQKAEWDNRSDYKQYSASKVDIFREVSREDAYESLEKCKQKCVEWSDCLAWRYNPGYCGLDRSVRLGQQALRWKEGLDDESMLWTSGWMLDRIKDVRSQSGCDPLENDEVLGQEESQILPGLNIRLDANALSTALPSIE